MINLIKCKTKLTEDSRQQHQQHCPRVWGPCWNQMPQGSSLQPSAPHVMTRKAERTPTNPVKRKEVKKEKHPSPSSSSHTHTHTHTHTFPTYYRSTDKTSEVQSKSENTHHDYEGTLNIVTLVQRIFCSEQNPAFTISDHVMILLTLIHIRCTL